MKNTDYHPGGFNPSAPAFNRAAEWDTDAATFTRWDESGTVIESRPLTADEIAALTPPPPPPNPAADALDSAADQAEQSLIADVRDLAVQLRAAADALRGQ